MSFSTIRLKEQTIIRLLKEKESLSETYDDVLKKLLDELDYLRKLMEKNKL